MEDKKELNGVVNSFKVVTEAIPELHEDIVKPVVQETGKSIALIPRAIHAALAPVEKWIMHQEYSLEATKKLLAQKLAKIDEEKIVSPAPYIAVPALQAISYSMDSDQLRELYANLLAKSMNRDMQELVHPSFVEIIKQLSPLDSRVFSEITVLQNAPVINLALEFDILEFIGSSSVYATKSWYEKARQKELATHFLERVTNLHWMTFAPYNNICVSMDNLIRLGLIETRTCKENDLDYASVKNTDGYEEVRASLFNTLKEKIKKHYPDIDISNTTEHFHELVDNHYTHLTSLGHSFAKICMQA